MLHSDIEIWTDTNISPAIAKWLGEEFNITVISFYKLNFHTETDYNIFMKAKESNVIFMTKDKDYINLLATFKAPPYIVLLKTGNISNEESRKKLRNSFPKCLDLILNHNYQNK